MNPSLVKCPNIIKVNVPIPNEETREDFLQYNHNKERLVLEDSISINTMAKITGGLNLVNINQIISESFQEKRRISMEYLREKRKNLLNLNRLGCLKLLKVNQI